MELRFDSTITKNFKEASSREWLETNGIGGWAASTISGAHTRRYHGLLVAADDALNRFVLVSKLEETICCGGRRVELGCNEFPSAVHPRGFEQLTSFSKHLFPVFEFHVEGIHLRKTVCCPRGQNTTLVLYEVLKSPHAFTLDLRPFIAGRNYHELTHANDVIKREAAFNGGIFSAKPYPTIPEVFISVPGASYHPSPDWYFNFHYPIEESRGYDFREDLFTHGAFQIQLKSGSKFGVILSTQNPRGKDAFELFKTEEKRRNAILKASKMKDDLGSILTLAADQFIIRRGAKHSTLIAGYHWFTDWGRDTMISLPGLCLATGRFEEAREILSTFADSVSEGMIPNRFLEGKGEPEYNNVDGTLWFFIAAYKYYEATKDKVFITKLYPILKDIIDWHIRGTRYDIRVDVDGLLCAGNPTTQLTWMDARIGNWPVTARPGKPVEVNALWYNALVIMAKFGSIVSSNGDASEFVERAKIVKDIFEVKFWSEEYQCLYDYIDGSHKDICIRPNQIFALSLPFPLLPEHRARKVLKTVEEKLLTPFGLRSLDPNHPQYCARYSGVPATRDYAYHQGTVWSWLIGPFASALVRYEGKSGQERARQLLNPLIDHLSKSGIGTISELFEGAPPHEARGCSAQAWSVAELLRVLSEDLTEKRPSSTGTKGDRSLLDRFLGRDSHGNNL